MNKGFTLIELLVVVLIIGILAAIALPQYTKAVERSRVAEAAQVLGDLATAQSIFYMQNNEFADNLTNLNKGDITVPGVSSSWTLNEAFATGEKQSATLTATRVGGMYDGSELTITVSDNGTIAKSCKSADTTGFGSIAKTAGYGNGTCTAKQA